MSGRRASRSITASPMLVGAVTILVVVVAVFLAYNANNGLPFAPTYTLHVRVPDAANLVKGNDVRIAGTRVGTVSAIAPVSDPATGAVSADLTLKLDKSVQPLAADTTALVRARSALGEKYLELTPGSAARKLADGATLPLANARPTPVQIDDLLNMFDAPTRRANQVNLVTFGDAVAGRGIQLNDAVGGLRPLLDTLQPVMRVLAAPSTRLAALFPALDRAAAQVAPVAEEQGQLFVDMDTTFRALASVAPHLQQAIRDGPPALAQAIDSLPRQRAFLAQATQFAQLLQPSAVPLRAAAPPLARALSAGTRNLGPAIALNERLATTLGAVGTFSRDPGVSQGIADLTDTAAAANPIVADLNGMQTTCNYVTLTFRNVASILSEGDPVGAFMRFVIVLSPQGPNNEGAPSSAPANGPGLDNHLHVDPYPNVGAGGAGGAAECEAGNERYLAGQTVVGSAPGNVGTGHDVTTRGAVSR